MKGTLFEWLIQNPAIILVSGILLLLLILFIYQALLDCAEEVAYPTSVHLLKMLQTSVEHPEQPWQPTWQDYLSKQLNIGHYMSYQEVILLCTSLFPAEKSQSPLVSLLIRHYDSDGTPVQRYAERFLATLSSDLRYLRDLRDLRYQLLTQEHTRKAINRLSPAGVVSINQVERVDLLTILLGRLL